MKLYKHNFHYWISMVKSALRQLGCLIAMLFVALGIEGVDAVAPMAVAFAFAEVLGILEEKYE